jgi:Holliday junction resolvase RusA-like endonuclease
VHNSKEEGIIAMREQTYTIMLTPVPWARAGWNQRTGRYYDTQFKVKQTYKDILILQHKDQELWYGPISCTFKFFMKLPVNQKARKTLEDQYYHKGTPDTSNLIKFIEDAAVGVLFDDDCIIAHIDAYKIYDITPRTELTIRGLCYEKEIF